MRSSWPVRRLIAALLAAAVVLSLTAACAAAANPISVENANRGDDTWRGALAAHVTYTHPPIDGYADATSVFPGGEIDFHVNVAQPGRYRVEIVRLGWYGGSGGRPADVPYGIDARPQLHR